MTEAERGELRQLLGAEEPTKPAATVDAVGSADTEMLAPVAVPSTDGEEARGALREQLLAEVEGAWAPPEPPESGGLTPAMLLRTVVLPQVRHAGTPLAEVLADLDQRVAAQDPAGVGLNLVVMDGDRRNPPVTLTLRNLTAGRVLELVTESVGYEVEVLADSVIVRPSEGGPRLETRFFSLNRSTLIRLSGGEGAPAAGADLKPAAAEEGLRSFLERAGVPFAKTPGSALALADGRVVVTHTRRHLDRVANILRRMQDLKQVEIEARFLEVQQGSLEEVGFNWQVAQGGDPGFDGQGNPIIGPDGEQVLVNQNTFGTGNRNLADAFSPQRPGSQVTINGQQQVEDLEGNVIASPFRQTLPQSGPDFPGEVDLGAGVGALANVRGVIGDTEFNVLLRALERETGSDLLSAPKVTVLSGRTAEIVVAREFRYPINYGDMQAQVGRGNSDSGSAGVAIVTGTPRDFSVRNVGVEMAVTPTVETDRAISLVLQPQVTEFDGFMQYGGTSVAIASSRTVTVPSGFYQPIFNVRRVRTEVTIQDGTTVVMGGLTREQAVSTKDKVPVLGDIPLLGRLFRSEGQSSQKRNLLIFVTARLLKEMEEPEWFGDAPR